MGLFTKKDADGLPAKYEDLVYEVLSRKSMKDPVYRFNILEKLKVKGIERWKAGKLKGYKSEYDDGDVGQFLDKMDKLKCAYENGEGCAVNKKAAFECVKLCMEISEEYLDKSQLSVDDIDKIPYIWEDMAYYYMTGEGGEKDDKLKSKYWMMAFSGWTKRNDEYGYSGVRMIRSQMSGYPYPMLGPAAYTLMATTLRSRGAEQGAVVMQEIESLAEMDYKRLGRSYAEDIAVCEEAAQKGNAYANYKLGKMYIDGKGVAKDTKRGLEYLKKAAETLAVAAGDLYKEYTWGEIQNSNSAGKWVTIEDKLQKQALQKYTVDKIKEFKATLERNNRDYDDEDEYDNEVVETQESSRSLPSFITDDMGRTWEYEGVVLGGARYRLQEGSYTNPEWDLGDSMGKTVIISDAEIQKGSARSIGRTFHW